MKKLGHDAEAVRVLEYGISCGSDHSGNYRMLADYYLNATDSAAIRDLALSGGLVVVYKSLVVGGGLPHSTVFSPLPEHWNPPDRVPS